MTIDELVAAAQNGDQEAFGRVYEATRGRLRGYVANRLYKATGRACGALVEDVLSDTYLKAWLGLHRYENQGRFEGWLATISYNILMDHFKSSATRCEVVLDWDENPWHEQAAPHRQTPEFLVELSDTAERLLAALSGLTDEQREAMLRRYYFDQSLQEVAAAMGKNEAAVRTMCYRARVSARRAGVV